MKILIIGNSTRSVVCSARKAGYTVYALDRFGDVDMLTCAHRAEFFEGMPEKRLYELAASFGKFDFVILGPGFEKLKLGNTLNNRLSVIEEVNDKLKITEKLSSIGMPHPETRTLEKASELEFPLMVKPRFGSGGIRNLLIRSAEELVAFKDRNDADEFIVQEFIEGIPCSASLISTGSKAAVIALNEQLIGVPWLTRMPFAYCGNVTPFHTKFNNEMIQYATRIAIEFNLVGSNGVDFIATEKGVFVIEINPRFQGSLDTVELSTGINIFDSHVKSFAGKLPEPAETICFAAKAIVYANSNITIDKKISKILTEYMGKGRATDIPQEGWAVRPDEPVATLIETGRTRKIVFDKISTSARHLSAVTEV